MNPALTRTRLIGRHIQAPLRPQSTSIFTANMSVRHYTSPTFAESRTRIQPLQLELMKVHSQTDKKNILNWVDPKDKSGEFKRQTSVFRNFISNKPGAEFPPEKGRYHLYVSYACPWAHRTLIVRKLKGLEDFVSYTSVHWEMLEKGRCQS